MGEHPTSGSGSDAVNPRNASPTLDEDVQKLHQLGYAQELARRMSGFSNFAVSFTIISILSGCLTLYGYGMGTGGPLAMNLGWLFDGALVTMVGLAMAEICSSYPTAGGLYYWSAKLARNNGHIWSWYTGWFNVIGQVGITAGIDFGGALFWVAFLNLTLGVPATPPVTVTVYGIVLFIHGLLNTFGVRLVALLNDISVWWHILGVLVIFFALYLIPAHHQSLSFVFFHFVNKTGWSSGLYVFFLGLLLAQYTFTGYDASAHMTEETHEAAVSGPRGIVMSIVVSWVAGMILLVGVTAAIQNYDKELSSATGVPPAQIFIDSLGQAGGLLLLLITIGAQFFCGMSSVTANSRMIYAFSRDGALPFSDFWHRINPKTRTPTNSIWLAASGAFVLGIPYLWSATAYAAITSIAVIGLYIAYMIPVFLRLQAGENFQRGPWHLGKWSRPIGIIVVAWVSFICVLFILPPVSPVTINTFNYAPAAVAVVLAISWLYWIGGARKWYKGPKVQGTPEELAAIEHELTAV